MQSPIVEGGAFRTPAYARSGCPSGRFHPGLRNLCIEGDPEIHEICCIKSPEEAALAIACGASALGLVSAMPSGRGVVSEAAIGQIARTVPPPIATSKDRILSGETEPDTPGSLQPERSKDNVLHDRVDITMPTLDGTVNIEGRCACRFIHASHHARRRLRGMVATLPYVTTLRVRHLCSLNACHPYLAQRLMQQ